MKAFAYLRIIGWCEHCPVTGGPCSICCGQAHGSQSRTVVTSLGYEMVARAEKARAMARTFIAAGIRSSDVAEIAPAQWQQVHGYLRGAGVLRPHATVPSAATVERTIAEMRKLEGLGKVLQFRRPAC
jgi:hypothetical protein